MHHTLISEKEAAELTGWKPRTLRQKVLAQGRCKDAEPLPITYNVASRPYRFGKEDIEAYIRRTTFHPTGASRQ